MYSMVFYINREEKLILEILDSLEEIDCCYEGLLVFIKNNEKKILSNDAVYDSMLPLAKLLTKALNNQLQINSSQEEDIGFLYNQYNYGLWLAEDNEAGNLEGKTTETDQVWGGIKYHLWASKDLVTWLYNDKDGQIIFEITPYYPYFFSESQTKEHHISYQQWIQEYKPYRIALLSLEIAEQWLKQAQRVLQQIDDNIKRWSKEVDA